MKKTMMIKGEKMTKFTVHIGNFRDCNKNIRFKFNEYDNAYKTFASTSRKNIQYWNDNLTSVYLKQEEKEEKEFELFRDSFFQYLNNNEYFADNLEKLLQQNGVSGSNFYVSYNTEKLTMVRQKLSNALQYLESALSELNGDVPSSSSAYRQIMEIKSRMQQERSRLLMYEKYLNQIVNGIQNLLEQVSAKNKNVIPNIIQNHGFTFKGALAHINACNDDFKIVEDVTSVKHDDNIVIDQRQFKRVSDAVVSNQKGFENNLDFSVKRVSDTLVKKQNPDIKVKEDNHKKVVDTSLNSYSTTINNVDYTSNSVETSSILEVPSSIETLDFSNAEVASKSKIESTPVSVSLDDKTVLTQKKEEEINNHDFMVETEELNIPSTKKESKIQESVSSIDVK